MVGAEAVFGAVDGGPGPGETVGHGADDGAEILHRQDGDEISWVSLLRFESMDHIRAFAGASPERAVLEPKALALLSRHETHVRHFETRVLT